ncbi:hypothetical protein GQ53DRAFT_362346 [Thozetella sp. PMI_491]|nr:hypothetical protein GQ53DRAFT_362346 [Thozetella sp. PMI_491]
MEALLVLVRCVLCVLPLPRRRASCCYQVGAGAHHTKPRDLPGTSASSKRAVGCELMQTGASVGPSQRSDEASSSPSSEVHRRRGWR